MFTGIMDHWVPSHDAVSSFWKTPFETAAPLMDALREDVFFNHITFYSKWYSNGIESKLPFLLNHAESQNVLTHNQWGKRWIDFFHQRNITVGAMLQCYTFEPLPAAPPTLGKWPGLHRVTSMADDSLVADPTAPETMDAIDQMVREQLQTFPDLDAFFFEFEGLPSAIGEHRLKKMGQQDISNISPAIREQWRRTGRPENGKDDWIWTGAVQDELRVALKEQLTRLDKILGQQNFTGIRGVVYYAMGYETPYILDALPSRDWWLLPWHYWGWDFAQDTDDTTVRLQLDWCKEQFRDLTADNRPLCYLGNATLPTCRPETIEEMVVFLREIQAAGHLGMGNPIPEIGLRWHEATEISVKAARDLYSRLFPPAASS